MLSVAFEFESPTQGKSRFELDIAPSKNADAVIVTMRYPSSDVPEQTELTGYALWSECGYKAIAKVVRAMSAPIRELTGSVEVSSLEISVKGVGKSETKQPELSKITFTATPHGGQVSVKGLLGPAVFLVPSEIKDVYSIAENIFASLLLSMPGDDAAIPSTVPVYHGETVDDFIFVNELPEGTMRWFVAFDTAFKKKSIYRDGVVAPLQSWKKFRSGDF